MWATFLVRYLPSEDFTDDSEHFSTPLYFAQKHHGLDASLISFPSGTGHMVQALQAAEIDVGIGLTEGWVAGLGKLRADAAFSLVGTYVESPLCWAVSTGAGRSLESLQQCHGRKMGVSRVGSGSYVMGYVLADQQKWLGQPFEVVPLNTFDKLRQAVNQGTADFFLWEYYTSKRYYDNGEIKQIDSIFTPWSSWKIVSRDPAERTGRLLDKINKGIEYFHSHPDEAVEYISTELDYSVADAKAWLETVRFARDVRGVDHTVVDKTISALVKAGVLEMDTRGDAMIGISKSP